MVSLPVVLCFIVGVISYVLYSFRKVYSYWKDRGVPYAEPVFPLGNLPSRTVHFKDVLQPLYDQKPSDFPFLGAYFFRTPVVCATDLDFVQNVLVKDFSSFHERGMYVNEKDDPLSAHMFSVDGEKWKILRAKLSPTFTSGKMKFMFSTVVEVADRFHTVLADIVKTKADLEMKDLLARFTTDVIGSCAFGIECNSLHDPDSDFRRYGAAVFDDPPHTPLAQFFMMQYPELARKLHMKTMKQEVSDFFLDTVRQTIDFREKNSTRRNDFMDLLLLLKNNKFIDEKDMKTEEGLSFGEIAAQAFLFFLAGFETSSTTMMFSLYELALNQDVQEKARNEIESVLSNYDGKLTYEAVKDMVYIDQIITEALRKYPPVVNIIRKAGQDFRVPKTNVTIEKGTSVFIPAYAIQHDPEIYPNPTLFDPDRFSPEQVKNRHPLSFLSFGDGPRNCVGLRFGRMQSRIGLITLLKNFRFRPCAKTTIPMVFSATSAILSPLHGMHLEVEKI